MLGSIVVRQLKDEISRMKGNGRPFMDAQRSIFAHQVQTVCYPGGCRANPRRSAPGASTSVPNRSRHSRVVVRLWPLINDG